MIPKDPVILLSFINLKLRDFYPNLADFCYDVGVEEQEIREKLALIGYHYSQVHNQFVS